MGLYETGINYYLDQSDYDLKRELNELPVTLLLFHGNHEERPEGIGSYEERPWRGGSVYVEPEFPSLLFAKNGKIYDLEGCRAVAIGGAYSVDKFYRLSGGAFWFPSEQPDKRIKRRGRGSAGESRMDRRLRAVPHHFNEVHAPPFSRCCGRTGISNCSPACPSTRKT